MTNKAIWPYSFINKGTQRDMLYYCLTKEMSSKENSHAIGSFLWVVMLSMIMKPQRQIGSVQRQSRSSQKHFGQCYEWPVI